MPAEKTSAQMSWSEIHRVAYLKWRDAPPGMSPALADQFIPAAKASASLPLARGAL
jgi:hypothetical protein